MSRTLPVAALVTVFSFLNSCAEERSSNWYLNGTQTQVGIQPNGSIRVNGQAFFPFGFYHISWADEGTAGQRLNDLNTIANAGFNVMLTEPIKDTNQEMLPLLKLAEQKKLFILAHNVQPTSVKLLAQQPSLLGFTLMDDSNYNSSPAVVARLQDTYKSLAPHKLTSITLAVASDRPESGFFGVSDSVSNMSYPIGGTDELGVIYQVMRQTVKESQARGVVPLASLQTFAWPQRRWPSGPELRNMTFQAVMAGIKGIAYYSYRSDGNLITDHPDLWDTAQSMAQQVRQLSPSLLNGERRELKPDGQNPSLLAVEFLGPSARYLIALNTSSQAQAFGMTLSDTRTLRPLFSDSGMVFNSGRLKGTMGPLAVQVYEVN
ncbi:hypothetical protein Q0M94_20465 (plasmid) [Deinococcus radiomollis]|uniref:hypothetical protein n=1 Tax=Deinococcus radiomollis TaxID=468916 RepID=UPI00389131DE